LEGYEPNCKYNLDSRGLSVNSVKELDYGLVMEELRGLNGKTNWIFFLMNCFFEENTMD
jgi:hypothetical protein